MVNVDNPLKSFQHLALFFTILVATLAFAAPEPETETGDGGEDEESWGIETSYRREWLYPSNYGTPGIFRLRSAESLPSGALTFGIGGEFYSTSNAPDFGFGNSQTRTIAESLFVGYAPTDRLTLALVRRNSSTTFGTPQQLISSLGDLNFSALYSIPLNDSFAVGPIANFLIASNFNELAPNGSTMSVGIGAAATYSFYPMTKLPLVIHGNLLYHMPQIRSDGPATTRPETFFNFSRYHTITWGAGAEFKLGDFIPFTEFQQSVQTSSVLGWGSSPSKVSVGARVTPISNKSLAFLLGADIGIGKGSAPGVPFSPDYQILGQVSYTVGLDQTERKHYHTTADVGIVDRKFIIRKNINFKTGSAELLSESESLLNEIAEVIKQNKIKKLLIVGHTDSSHTEEFNLELSLKRAGTVKTYLVNRGVNRDSLLTQGYGKKKPKASNLTETGRASNRRVEFFILE